MRLRNAFPASRPSEGDARTLGFTRAKISGATPSGAERGHGRLRPWLTVVSPTPDPRMISVKHAVYAGDGFRSLYAGPPWVASSPG